MISSSGLPVVLTGSALLELVSTGSVPVLEVGSVGFVPPALDVGFVGSVGSVTPALDVGFVGSVGFVAPALEVGFVGSVGSVGFVATDDELNFSIAPVFGSTVALATQAVRAATSTPVAIGAPFKSMTTPVVGSK